MPLQRWLIQAGQSKTIDLESVGSLKVGLLGGQVDIIGHDEPGVRIEVHSVVGRDLKITLDNDHLEIDHPQLRWDNFIEVFSAMRTSTRADISLVVPRDVTLTFGVVSASALIAGLVSGAKVSTVSGDVVIDDTVGPLDLNSVSGEISVRGHRGGISANTVSGDITATGALSSFHSKGVSGDLVLDIAGTPDSVDINTVSGNTTIRLPETDGLRYRVSTVSGRVQLDDLVVRGSMGKASVTTAGNLDGSWADISAKSVSGNFSVISNLSHAATQNEPV